MINLIKRMKDVNYEITGEKWPDDEDEVAGMTPFDAQKYILAKKLGFIREKIARLDEVLKTKKGGVKQSARLANEIKKMIKVVKGDYEKLEKLHEKYAKKKFSIRKPDPNRIKREQEDLALIKKHMIEVEELDRKRHQRKEDKKKKKKKDLDVPEMDGGEDDSLAARIALASQLPDDPTQSNLPVIDISAQMAQVDKLNQKMDEHMDILGKKLVQLKEIATDIGAELDTQNARLDSLESKVDKEMQRLEALNKRVDNALDAVGGSTKLFCIIAIIVVIVAMIGIAAIFIINYFPAPQ